MAETHGFSMGTVAGTSIPVEHLDYGYIEKCKNARELEKIVQVLRRVALGGQELCIRIRCSCTLPPSTCAAGRGRKASIPSWWSMRRSA